MKMFTSSALWLIVYLNERYLKLNRIRFFIIIILLEFRQALMENIKKSAKIQGSKVYDADQYEESDHFNEFLSFEIWNT